MDFQLVIVSGRHKGAAVEFRNDAILIGRHKECDVVIPDLRVSRRHCRITHDSGVIHIEDLGSVNPTLVNGIPCGNAVLSLGDEIAVGSWVFLLTRESDSLQGKTPSMRSERRTTPPPDSKTFPFSMDDVQATQDTRPRTLDELMFLYECSTEFSAAESVQTLVGALRRRLTQQFQINTVRIARVRAGDELTYYDDGALAAATPFSVPGDLIGRALKERRGLMAVTARGRDKKQYQSDLVVPAQSAGTIVALVILHSDPGDPVCDEDDLRMALLIVRAFAPFLSAVEEVEQLRRDFERLRVRSGESLTIIGNSQTIRDVRLAIAEAARSGLSVLITGESGTGKELAARQLHIQSTRQNGPFISVNCAAIPRDLFESEFFGYEKGAFTGAVEARSGLLAMAHGGTLFLDEIGDLTPENQARILRALETGQFRRIGAKEETQVDVRFVSATNADIPAAISAGRFREDLYHRLNGFEIRMPSLRDRPSDIPLLADYFFNMLKSQGHRPLEGIRAEAKELLAARRWPGNVRELRNALLRAIAVAQGPWIEGTDFRETQAALAAQGKEEVPISLDAAEKRHIANALLYCKGNVPETAKVLGLSRSTLYRKISEHGIAL